MTIHLRTDPVPQLHRMERIMQRATAPRTRRVVRAYLTEQEYAVVAQFLLDLRAGDLQLGQSLPPEMYTLEHLTKQALLGLVAAAYRDSAPTPAPAATIEEVTHASST